ncbi:MAG: hypothetical protein VKJ64_07720 [Leptolyngbyaceae bacterium]|nr:hypothetical protein [Leptolyngbyaceae bacterium]
MWRSSSSKIAYLVETFPQPENSPITQEILDLEHQGLSLHIFSLRLPNQQSSFAAACQVQSPVTYIPSMLPSHIPEDEDELMGAHVDLLRCNSQGHFKALDIYLKRPEGKQLNELLQAGYMALQLQRQGISHVHTACEYVSTATIELIHHICGATFSLTAEQTDLHQIDPQILARRITPATFIFTSTANACSYLQEIVMTPPPIYVEVDPQEKAIAFFESGVLTPSSSPQFSPTSW